MIDVSNPEAVIAESRRRKERRDKGLPINETPEEIAAAVAQRTLENDDRLEKEIQRDVVRIYRAHGCVVYETSQKRASKVTPGIPDLIVFAPRAHVMFWHEVKTPSGKLRPDQKDFRDVCISSSVSHFVGGVEAARFALAVHGIGE